MSLYDDIRDRMHVKLIDAGTCPEALGYFLDNTKNIPMLIEQLKAHIPFILKNDCITDGDLMSLVADENFDFVSVYKEILVWSVRMNRWEFVDWFLRRAEFGADLDDALYHAARLGRLELIGVLLKHGVSPDGRDGAPLRYAAACGQEKAVSALLEAGANPSLRKKDAARMAREAGHDSIVALLSPKKTKVAS